MANKALNLIFSQAGTLDFVAIFFQLVADAPCSMVNTLDLNFSQHLDGEVWLILLKNLTHLHFFLPLAILEDKGPQSIYVQAAANHKTKCTQMCKTFAKAQLTQGLSTMALAKDNT